MLEQVKEYARVCDFLFWEKLPLPWVWVSFSRVILKRSKLIMQHATADHATQIAICQLMTIYSYQMRQRLSAKSLQAHCTCMPILTMHPATRIITCISPITVHHILQTYFLNTCAQKHCFKKHCFTKHCFQNKKSAVSKTLFQNRPNATN